MRTAQEIILDSAVEDLFEADPIFIKGFGKLRDAKAKAKRLDPNDPAQLGQLVALMKEILKRIEIQKKFLRASQGTRGRPVRFEQPTGVQKADDAKEKKALEKKIQELEKFRQQLAERTAKRMLRR